MSASPSTALAQAVGLEDELVAAGLGELQPLLQPLLDELSRRTGRLFANVAPEDFAAGFEDWWQRAPIKCAKVAARKAAKVASGRRDWPGWPRAVTALEEQKQSARWKAGTIPNPETWFRSGRYLDDAASLTAIGRPEKRDEMAEENAWMERMREL